VVKHKHPDSKNYYLLDYFDFSDATTIDLSSYDGLHVSLDYSGPSESLYFFLRNAEKLPANFAEYEAIQFMHVDFNPAEKEVFIDFSRIQVPRWWIDRFGTSVDLRQMKLDHVYDMGIELPALPAAGAHKLKLKRIAAKKSYISQMHLLLLGSAVVGFGCLVLIVQGLWYYQKKENETLRTKMVVDPLTKCLNRLGLETALKGVFPLSNSSSVYVMVLDLDHFKKINDTLGHAAGDEVLQQAATVLAKELRSDDVFGRWGGEEFIIISRVHRDALENMISRLMRSLRSISIDGASTPSSVTMSIGVTEAQIGESFDEVFKRADEAMYQVKQAGRGDWRLV
jgi:diguanylate cyclase (GGDEF)-like protein